ncbi:hypothetical protein LJC45_01590 [Alistipes sp. OttesenSCG-928-B03]|nr:hypothetical protein [Alistipes sp. OttesenSCG-928-B03]
MATACKIGIVKENGKVECVCCWYNGNPDNAGQTLANHYDTYEKTSKLIDKGQIMELAETIRKTRFQKPEGWVTEADCKPITYMTQAAFFRADHGQRYTYLFKDGQWWMTEE